jgi:clan AA aspartic protease (TIGR02281 family)
MRLLGSGLVLSIFLLAAPAAAEIYRWTDENGRVHFTQDLGQVPPRYRKQAETGAKSSSGSSRVQTYSGGSSTAGRALPARAASGGVETYQVHRIRVQRAGTTMLVNARLNNAVTAPFLIDTGASDVLIPQSVADRLGLQIGPDTRTKRYSTANGIVEHPVVMLRSVSLGEASVENVPASVSPSMEVGLLGLSFFNHFTYNIDAAAGVVTLTRNRLAESGRIRGGRSQAQWRSEYANLRWRIAQVEREYAQKATSKTRERRRLEEERANLEHQLELLEAEADHAHVPMAWRQ